MNKVKCIILFNTNCQLILFCHKIINRMKRRQQAGYVANCLNDHLLSKVGTFIKRREKVLANTHRHCFNKLSHMIGETNQQVTYTVNRGKHIDQVEDMNTIKPDNLSSVPEPKMITSPKRSEPNSGTLKEKRQRNSSFFTRQRRSMTCSDLSFLYNETRRNSLSKTTNKPSGINTVIPLQICEDEEEDKRFQLLRMAKELQAEEEEKERLRLFELNRRKVKVDLSNQRVMYDFDCRISKLQAPRTRDMQEMLQMSGRPGNEEVRKNLSPYNSERGTAASTIKKVSITNITEKNSEKERQRMRFAKTRFRKAQEELSQNIPTYHVVVNPDSHIQTQKAYALEGEGIRIKIEDRVLSYKKETPTFKETIITRRLSKPEFVEFKKNEQKRKRSMLLKFKNEERARAKSENKIVTEIIEEEPPEQQENKQTHELKYPYVKSDHGSESITVSNQLMMEDLLRQYKDKQSLKTIEKPTNNSDSQYRSMSSVDRYNLLYVKYGGKPPTNLLDVAKELRSQSHELAQKRIQAGSKTDKKYSWVGVTRMSTMRNKDVKERHKTQI